MSSVEVGSGRAGEKIFVAGVCVVLSSRRGVSKMIVLVIFAIFLREMISKEID